MQLRFKSWSALALSCVAVTSGTAQAALEVALHEVNTSVGLKATNATNQWKLQTDPQVNDPDSSLVPLAGALDNTYDPTQFSLDVGPGGNPLLAEGVPDYQLGYSVQGDDPFKVTSFDVFYNNGGYYHVSASSDPRFDNVTPVDEPSGGEAGLVEHINFVLDPSLKNEVLPANQDQNFFELNLTALENTPNIIPMSYSTGGSPGDFVTIGDPGDGANTHTITFGGTGDDGDPVVFQTSYLPEPTAVGVLCIGAFGLMSRKKKA
jgi:hypothetical protein